MKKKIIIIVSAFFLLMIIGYHMLISKNIKDFAILTTEQEIIATSEKAYRLCADHLSYEGDGKMAVSDIDGKLTLK